MLFRHAFLACSLRHCSLIKNCIISANSSVSRSAMLSCTTSSALFVALLASLSLVCPAGSASRPALLDSVVNNVQRTWLVSGNDAGLRPDSKKALPAEGVAAEASGASSQQVFRNPVQDSNSFLRRLTRKGAPGQGKGDRNPSSSAASSGSAASRASRDSRSGPRQYDVPQIGE